MKKLVTAMLCVLLVLPPAPAFAIGQQWAPFSIPAQVTQLRDIAYDGTNWYLADQLTGVWANCGGSFAQVNTGLPASGSNVIARTISIDATHSQIIAGLVNGSSHPEFWRSSNCGTSWTKMNLPAGIGSGNIPDFSGVIVTGNGTLVGGIQNGTIGTCGAFYSTDAGATLNLATCSTSNGTSPPPLPGGTWSVAWNSVKGMVTLGTEQNGLECSSDNGATYTPCSPPEPPFLDCTGKLGIRVGNLDASSSDASGHILFVGQGGAFLETGTAACNGFTFANTKVNTGQVSGDGKGLFKDSSNGFWFGHGKSNIDITPVYFSSDGGHTWTPRSNGLPSAASPTNAEAWKFVQLTSGEVCALIIPATTNIGQVYCTLTPTQPGPAPAMFAHFENFFHRLLSRV